MRQPALLALEDGSLFYGESIGIEGQATGEVVFNTAITGYQEILTDPSYCKQIITLTYPHIGNTGANDEDEESSKVMASGLVIRDLPLLASNWRMRETLDAYLRRQQVVGIAGIDTRRLTRLLREKGAQNGCIMAGRVDEAQALAAARAFPGLKGMDLAKVVSTEAPYHWDQPSWKLGSAAPTPEPRYHVVAYDYGVKRNILRMLVDRGCRVTVVPAQTPAFEVLAMKPDGVFLSNGPGDPEPCDYAIAAIRVIVEEGVPVFGICLGHQLLALAGGANTVKMKFGHHGANHPVQDLGSGQVVITSQNHGFAVDESSLPATLCATHRSLFDGSLQGISRTDRPAFSFQGHPEASPGPRDAASLFDRFIELMKCA
ncbi:MAG: glutamine-hydrolyzing carbamoyl-phosphate synthase small subunit [Gammaproteobacteria bacterium]|nr:glutamine-hydrolyzing carbamoyl-phosphate synthase small subunit [Gammaproteobacteria bacterium]